ncbi:MAG: preprotein translocase subunit SecE [Rickettsiales bacterium]|jgi:preprotein translocase SecE subunit|nr:preprotein translocase subunit SecE [Rickettsiales bacterium]
MQQLLNYFKDIIREARNITFPTGRDVKITSVVVAILVGIFMTFISCADFVISKLVKLFFGIM